MEMAGDDDDDDDDDDDIKWRLCYLSGDSNMMLHVGVSVIGHPGAPYR